MLFAYFSTCSYFASCLVCVREGDTEVVLLVELDLELLFVLEVRLLIIFPARLLRAVRKFLDLRSAFLELLIFILYSYPFLFTFCIHTSMLFVKSGSILVYVIYIGILIQMVKIYYENFHKL